MRQPEFTRIGRRVPSKSIHRYRRFDFCSHKTEVIAPERNPARRIVFNVGHTFDFLTIRFIKDKRINRFPLPGFKSDFRRSVRLRRSPGDHVHVIAEIKFKFEFCDWILVGSFHFHCLKQPDLVFVFPECLERGTAAGINSGTSLGTGTNAGRLLFPPAGATFPPASDVFSLPWRSVLGIILETLPAFRVKLTFRGD